MANGDQNNQGGPDSPLGMGAAGGLLALLGIGARRDFLTPTMAEVSRRAGERRKTRKEEEASAKRVASQKARLDAVLAGDAGDDVRAHMESQGLERGVEGFDPGGWETPEFNRWMEGVGEVVALHGSLPAQIAMSQSQYEQAYPGEAPEGLFVPWLDAGWEDLTTTDKGIALASFKVAFTGIEERETRLKNVEAEFSDGVSTWNTTEATSPGAYFRSGEAGTDATRLSRSELDPEVKGRLALNFSSLLKRSEIDNVVNGDGNWSGRVIDGDFKMLNNRANWTPAEKSAYERIPTLGNSLREGSPQANNFNQLRLDLQNQAAVIGTAGAVSANEYGDARINAAAQTILDIAGAGNLNMDYKTFIEKAEAAGKLGDVVGAMSQLGSLPSALKRRTTRANNTEMLKIEQTQWDKFNTTLGLTGKQAIQATDLWTKTYDSTNGVDVLTQPINDIATVNSMLPTLFSGIVDLDAFDEREEQLEAACLSLGIDKATTQSLVDKAREDFELSPLLPPSERLAALRKVGHSAAVTKGQPLVGLEAALTLDPPSVLTGGKAVGLNAKGEEAHIPSKANVRRAADAWLEGATKEMQGYTGYSGAVAALDSSSFKATPGKTKLSDALAFGKEAETLDELKEVLSHPELGTSGFGWEHMLTSLGLTEAQLRAAIVDDSLAVPPIDTEAFEYAVYSDVGMAGITQQEDKGAKLIADAEQPANAWIAQSLTNQAKTLLGETAVLREKAKVTASMRAITDIALTRAFPHLSLTGNTGDYPRNKEGTRKFIENYMAGSTLISVGEGKALPMGAFDDLDDNTSKDTELLMWRNFFRLAADGAVFKSAAVDAQSLSEVVEGFSDSIANMQTLAEDAETSHASVLNVKGGRDREDYRLRGVKLSEDYDTYDNPKDQSLELIVSILLSQPKSIASRRKLQKLSPVQVSGATRLFPTPGVVPETSPPTAVGQKAPKGKGIFEVEEKGTDFFGKPK